MILGDVQEAGPDSPNYPGGPRRRAIASGAAWIGRNGNGFAPLGMTQVLRRRCKAARLPQMQRHRMKHTETLRLHEGDDSVGSPMWRLGGPLAREDDSSWNRRRDRVLQESRLGTSPPTLEPDSTDRRHHDRGQVEAGYPQRFAVTSMLAFIGVLLLIVPSSTSRPVQGLTPCTPRGRHT